MKAALNILHLTDLHLFKDPNQTLAGINPRLALKAVLQDLAKRQNHITPDAIFLTGDLSQDCSEESYRTAYKMLTKAFSGVPIIATSGNHDHPKHFKTYFGDNCGVFDNLAGFTGWRFIVLNSQQPGKVAGALNKDNLELLAKGLTGTKRPIAVITHHHLFPVGSEWLDNIGMINYNKWQLLIKHCPNVRLVLSGHVHQETSSIYRGVTYLTTPATSWQFMLHHDDFKLDYQMPGYRWLKFTAAGNVFSHVIRVPHRAKLLPKDIKGY